MDVKVTLSDRQRYVLAMHGATMQVDRLGDRHELWTLCERGCPAAREEPPPDTPGLLALLLGVQLAVHVVSTLDEDVDVVQHG